MEEEDDIDLGLEDELERALEMEDGKRHVSHDLTIFAPFQGGGSCEASWAPLTKHCLRTRDIPTVWLTRALPR